MELTKEELLKKVWETCTFDEIIDKGFEQEKCTAQDLINASSEFSDTNQEYSDDEIKDIVKDADISIVIEALLEKNYIKDIIELLDENEVLNYFDDDDLLDHIDGSRALNNYVHSIEDESWNAGYDECEKNYANAEEHPLRDGSIDEKWCYLCDELGVGYYDENLLKSQLNELFATFNKTIYKKLNNNWNIN